MPKQKQRSTNRNKKKNGNGGSVAVSSNIPPPNYLKFNLAGVAQNVRRTLVWCPGAVNTTLAANTYANLYKIILNSPYDPDNAVGGTSATGFAKYMAFYTKCFVLGARIRLKFAVSGSGAAGDTDSPHAVGMTITTDTTTFSDVSDSIASGLCDYKLHNHSPDSGVLELAVDVAKFVDKPIILDDPQFFCTASANPSQVIVAQVWTKAPNAVASNNITTIVEVYMDCIFTDPTPFS